MLGPEEHSTSSLLSSDPHVIESTGAMELGDVPEKLLIIGGG
jgi:pyruvate/2-oxoglutarate dehydrogenase complex dihydrolipoamide dehydrogenase (E3) component